MTNDGTETIDLLVAGAGGGLAGAIRAARAGLRVVIVESSRHFLRSSNTAMSTAMIPGAGSRFQREAGLTDSADTFAADVRHKTHGEADSELTRALAAVSAPLVEWMADDLGLPIELVTDFEYPGHTVHRCHTVAGRSGANLLAMLHDVARRTDGLDLLMPARLLSAVATDPGWIATVEFPDGSQETIAAGAVLLATNGFGADADLVARHIPEIAGATYHGSDQSRGDALRIGVAAGADSAYLDAYQGHGALTVGAATLAGWALVMNGGVILNNDGRRFADESQGYSEFAALELREPGQSAVLVYDTRVREQSLSFEDYRQTEAAGVVKWADSARDLATAFGLDAAAVTAELDAAAAVVTSARADDFGRTQWGGDQPLRPPYAGVRVQPALFHTQGGLRVDGQARVLDRSGHPIDGLYAAGGAAMGISGHGAAGYLAGNGLLTGFGLAVLAADHWANAGGTA